MRAVVLILRPYFFSSHHLLPHGDADSNTNTVTFLDAYIQSKHVPDAR